MTKQFRIAALAGDGVGKEIMPIAVDVLNAVQDKFGCKFLLKEALVGYEAYKQAGTCLPEETLELCKKSNAILFGAIGSPEADKLPVDERPERAALLPLRKQFDLFANLRPAKVFRPLVNASPLKKELVGELDLLIVRELTSGIYFGKHRKQEDWASDEMLYREKEIERIATVAFDLAKNRGKKVTSVDKANVLNVSVLWRLVVEKVAKNYPSVELNHIYVDNAAMQLVRYPKQFDVILTGNMFGDILSDEASVVAGSIGMLPSASINETGFGLFEPIHGSAPDIAGQNKVNPIAQILSAGMMLKYSFGLEKEADAIEKAVERVLEKGYRTADIMEKGMKQVGTMEMGELIIRELK